MSLSAGRVICDGCGFVAGFDNIDGWDLWFRQNVGFRDMCPSCSPLFDSDGWTLLNLTTLTKPPTDADVPDW